MHVENAISYKNNYLSYFFVQVGLFFLFHFIEKLQTPLFQGDIVYI